MDPPCIPNAFSIKPMEGLERSAALPPSVSVNLQLVKSFTKWVYSPNPGNEHCKVTACIGVVEILWTVDIHSTTWRARCYVSLSTSCPRVTIRLGPFWVKRLATSPGAIRGRGCLGWGTNTLLLQTFWEFGFCHRNRHSRVAVAVQCGLSGLSGVSAGSTGSAAGGGL